MAMQGKINLSSSSMMVSQQHRVGCELGIVVGQRQRFIVKCLGRVFFFLFFLYNFLNNINFYTILLVSTFSKLFRKLTSQLQKNRFWSAKIESIELGFI